jgi:hypothetical protein
MRYFLGGLASKEQFHAMKTCLRTTALVAVLAALSAPAFAQWPRYPSPNVPRTADGEPDLKGPVPRTADGKPDLTGLWEIRRGGFAGPPPGGIPADGAPPPPPSAPPPPPPGTPPLAAFFDIGANIEGGAPYQPWAKEVRDQRVADGMKDNPDAHCLPMGYMQLHGHPQPRKIVQTPDMIVIMYEGNSGLRQIFTDGRSLPDNDPQPWWYGYSVGRWEDDELVVESIGFRDDGWLDVNGSPLTDQGKIVERFRRPDFGSLEIDITIDDPKAYTAPFTVRINQQIMLDEELIEFICNENEKSTVHFDP